MSLSLSLSLRESMINLPGMDGVAWRGFVYAIFILNFVFVCQLLLLPPLVSALGIFPLFSFSFSVSILFFFIHSQIKCFDLLPFPGISGSLVFHDFLIFSRAAFFLPPNVTVHIFSLHIPEKPRCLGFLLMTPFIWLCLHVFQLKWTI